MTMNTIKSALIAAVACASLFAAGCGNKNEPILTEQCKILNAELSELAGENPNLIASAKAEYTTDKFAVDVTFADSLIIIAQISDPLFEYFTACEVKNHLNKNLEAAVNALSSEDLPVTVTLTDVYGESRSYEIKPAALRRMVTVPLTQFNFTEAREGLFAALAGAEELFRPQEKQVKSITTSFKGGFFAYNIEFANASAFRGLTSANIKARALKVLEKRYANLGTLKPILFEMYKSLGIDGFHLVYTDGDKTTLKTTIVLSNL